MLCDQPLVVPVKMCGLFTAYLQVLLQLMQLPLQLLYLRLMAALILFALFAGVAVLLFQ